jgi:1,4-dihydroxy-2-naphthoyl-CoA hydrolase
MSEEQDESWKQPGSPGQPNRRHNLATLMGIKVEVLEPGHVVGEMEVRPDLMQPWGFVHGGAIVSLADSLCGIGCASTLDPTKEYFLTVELKTNFTRAVREGMLKAEAKTISRGRQVQLWECRVSDEAGKLVAFLTATQLIQKL